MRPVSTILYTILLTLFACGQPAPENKLRVNTDHTALKREPGIQSTELTVMRQHEQLIDQGIVANFESSIAYDGEMIQAPWLKVQTKNKTEGWVFAGAVMPEKNAREWLLQKRLVCYFGQRFSRQLEQVATLQNQVQTDADCARYYRETVRLRDSMVFALQRRAEPETQPDFSWIDGVLPGYIFQKIGDHGVYLFADFRFWRHLATKTKGMTDDHFFDFTCSLFPTDSIESFFPVWKFQLSEDASASRLGEGKHLAVLQNMDALFGESGNFEKEISVLKEWMLDDILDKNSLYWQPENKILTELDGILNARLQCLEKDDSNALQRRRRMMESPETHGIRVNLRSGI